MYVFSAHCILLRKMRFSAGIRVVSDGQLELVHIEIQYRVVSYIQVHPEVRKSSSVPLALDPGSAMSQLTVHVDTLAALLAKTTRG